MVLTFGEIMLRLKAPGTERLLQRPMLEATFGGGEANVAVSLANYGMQAAFLTVLPENPVLQEGGIHIIVKVFGDRYISSYDLIR